MAKSFLLFGGSSEERMVSVASAQNISKQFQFTDLIFLSPDGKLTKVPSQELQEHKNAFTEAFVPKEPSFANSLEEAIPLLSTGTVFLGFHGVQGEDGTIQALLEKNHIPFTGSGSVASRKAFEKDQAKVIAKKAKLSIAPELILREPSPAARAELKAFLHEHKKIVIKPIAQGSSFGLHFVSDESTLDKVVDELATTSYWPYIVEKFLVGRELTVGVIDEGTALKVLPPSEVIMTAGRAFDYQGKYLGQGSQEITPAQLTPEELASAQQMARSAHVAMGCYGYSRTDIMLTSDGPVFIETNTLPGLSGASFIPQQLAAAGIPFQRFIETQLALAEKRERASSVE